MTRQVYLTKFGIWSDIKAENDAFIMAADADGLNVYVIKDGTQLVREVK